jgi:hypothetical protein
LIAVEHDHAVLALIDEGLRKLSPQNPAKHTFRRLFIHPRESSRGVEVLAKHEPFDRVGKAALRRPNIIVWRLPASCSKAGAPFGA